jgi:hypothetical protein
MTSTETALILWTIIVLYYIGELLFHYYFWEKSTYKHQNDCGFWRVHLYRLIQLLPDTLKYILSKIVKNSWLYGEYQIYRTLEKMPWYGKILTNIYVDQWVTVDKTEVDILFLHETGIYCIESKDWCGYIYWSEKESSWTQYIARKPYSHHSPVLQNYWHIKSIEKLIPQLHGKMRWIVVFSNRSKIKIHSPSELVIQLRDLLKTIQKNPTTQLSIEDIQKWFTYFSQYTHASTEEKQKHITQIQLLQTKSPTLL